MDFERHLITLRFTRPVPPFHFNHGGALRGFLSAVLGSHDILPGLVPFACESGRIRFEPGDLYNIGVTLCGDSKSLLEPMLVGMRTVGSDRRGSSAPVPTLGGNFIVESHMACASPDISAEASALSGTDRLTLQFTSPLRLRRPPEFQVKGAGFLNGDCFPAGHFLQRLWNRLFFLREGRYPDREERDSLGLEGATSVNTDNARLLWLDLPISGRSAPGGHRPKGYTLGGVVGTIDFIGVPDSWLETLVLGQYLHAGENTHYGLGKYAIHETGSMASDPCRPAQSVLDRLVATPVLRRAMDHVLASSTAAGTDGVTPEDFAESCEGALEQLGEELRTGSYQPASLLGLVTKKDDGRLRPLAIPTVRDRIAQRAACECLSDPIDSLLEDCSFAYRKGLSRAGAARAIQAAYEDGYQYVLDADISCFFDSVDWDLIDAKLGALFPFEPSVSLLRMWIRAPVSYRGVTLQRAQGLPQGAPVSPLLANLHLDEFDEYLLGRDYRLVRYADDFVVLCKDIETAERAKSDAEIALSRLGLSVNESKTDIRTFDGGFTYLGYLFCRSAVVERSTSTEADAHALRREDIPPNSWLSHVPLDRIGILRTRGGSTRRRGVEVVPLVPRRSASLSADRPLYVTSPEVGLHLRGKTLVVESPEGEGVEVPIRSLAHVTLIGRTRITVPALLSLSSLGVPVYFCRRSGELYNVFTPHDPKWELWMAQASAVDDEKLATDFAGRIVAAKLHNLAALAVRFKLEDSGGVAARIRALEKACDNSRSIAKLRGLEGRGAALYFAAAQASLSPEWGFVGRRRRPPTDPINAVLSFGYTLLYNHISTALIAAGLNPRIGLYHHAKGAYHALACDLQEEFRHLVDALMWAMIHRREVVHKDFAESPDGRFPALMTHEFRGKFIGAFDKTLHREFTPENGEGVTYRGFMDIQARCVRDLVTGAASSYRPLRVHS